MLLESLLAGLMLAPPVTDARAPVGLAERPVLVAQQTKSPPPAKEPKTPPGPRAEAAPLAPDVKALVDRVQSFYEQMQDFTAHFEQQYSYKASKRKQTSRGKVTFKKPAMMRWEYASPSPKTFVLAGEKVYMHDPEAMLLTRANIGTSQLSASVTFLWGEGKLTDEFAIEKRSCASCKGVQLQLTPLKPDPRFKQILLEVDPKTAQVLKSTVIDPDGSQNAITFTELATNTGVNADAFKLNPPEGTQIQDYAQQP